MRASTSDSIAVLRQTGDNMVRIESGDLFVRFETAVADGDPSGFELDGPFSLKTEGNYPVAELDHKRFDGDEEQEGTFISDGNRVFVERGDERVRISDSQLAASGLAELARHEDGEDGDELEQLDVAAWIDGDPEVTGGGKIEGVDTDKVTADLDVAEVINGLIDLGRALGAGSAASLQTVEGTEMDRVRNATENATLQIWSGKKDHILRKLEARIEFAVANEKIAEKLGNLSGATITLEATLGSVNEPVDVEAP
jgi:hypothetical protein